MLHLETAACRCEQHLRPGDMLHQVWVCFLRSHGCVRSCETCGRPGHLLCWVQGCSAADLLVNMVVLKS